MFTFLGHTLSDEHVAKCRTPYSLPAYFPIFDAGARPEWVLVTTDIDGEFPLAFVVREHALTCWSHTLSLDPATVTALTRAWFSRYPRVRRTDFALVAMPPREPIPGAVMLQETEDFVLELPRRLDEYLGRLGPNTRKHLPYYTRKLRERAPDFAVEVARSADVTLEAISRLVELNRTRMATHGKVSGIDDPYLHRIYALARSCGLVVTIRANGAIIAGTIGFEVGGHYYLQVIAHDDRYSKLSPGQVGLLHTIEACIHAEHHTFHFLWGDSAYKRRFLGERRALRSFAVFRSRTHRWVGLVEGAPEILTARVRRFARVLVRRWRRSSLAKHVVDRRR